MRMVVFSWSSIRLGGFEEQGNDSHFAIAGSVLIRSLSEVIVINRESDCHLLYLYPLPPPPPPVMGKH